MTAAAVGQHSQTRAFTRVLGTLGPVPVVDGKREGSSSPTASSPAVSEAHVAAIQPDEAEACAAALEERREAVLVSSCRRGAGERPATTSPVVARVGEPDVVRVVGAARLQPVRDERAVGQPQRPRGRPPSSRRVVARGDGADGTSRRRCVRRISAWRVLTGQFDPAQEHAARRHGQLRLEAARRGDAIGSIETVHSAGFTVRPHVMDTPPSQPSTTVSARDERHDPWLAVNACPIPFGPVASKRPPPGLLSPAEFLRLGEEPAAANFSVTGRSCGSASTSHGCRRMAPCSCRGRRADRRASRTFRRRCAAPRPERCASRSEPARSRSRNRRRPRPFRGGNLYSIPSAGASVNSTHPAWTSLAAARARPASAVEVAIPVAGLSGRRPGRKCDDRDRGRGRCESPHQSSPFNALGQIYPRRTTTSAPDEEFRNSSESRASLNVPILLDGGRLGTARRANAQCGSEAQVLYRYPGFGIERRSRVAGSRRPGVPTSFPRDFHPEEVREHFAVRAVLRVLLRAADVEVDLLRRPG